MPEISRLVLEVDSKGIVTATGNLEQFNKAAAGAGKGADGLGDKIRKTKKPADDLSKSFAAFQLIVNKLPAPLQNVAAGLLGLVSPGEAVIGTLIDIGEAAVKYVKESIDAFAKFEMIKTNLEVVSASAGEASATFTELQRMAGRTPFNVDQLAEAATMLRQTGISANDLIPTLTMLGDVSGGSAEKFSRISMNFAQIQSTMKATAMDIRQFAMAGIPIYKVLEEMGVTGTATADDITEAFRRMTEAGGQFYGAMEKGATTLTGMKTNLEGLKEQVKALRSEVNGWSDAAKGWTQNQTQYYQKQQAELLYTKEIQGFTDKKKSGTYTIVDEYKEAEVRLAEIKRLIEDINNTPAGRGREQQNISITNLEKQLQLQTDIIDQLQPQIDIINQITAAQAEYNAMLEESDKGYRNLQGKIEEAYAKTHEGQIKAIENEIKWWQEEQKRQRYVDSGYTYGPDGRKGIKTLVDIPDEEKSQIDKIIEMLTEKLDKVLGKAKETKHEFASWVEILAQATGYSKDNVEALKGLGTVEKYAAEVKNIQDRLLGQGNSLLETLGLDNTGILENSVEKVRTLLASMLNSGEWNGTEQSVQFLINKLKELEGIAGASAFQDVIAELDRERKLQESPVANQVRAATEQMLKDNGVSDPTANQIDIAIGKAGENYLSELTEQLKEASMSTYDLAVKRLANEKGISEYAAKEALATQKKIDYITNGYDIMGEIAVSIDDALRSIRSGNGGYGQYAGAKFAEAGMGMLQGSDVGNFVEGFQQGGIWVAIIETLVGAISKVIGGMEEMDKALNPVTELLSNIGGLIKFIHEIITQVFDLLIDAFTPFLTLIGELFQAIQPLVSEMINTIMIPLKDAFTSFMPLIALVKNVLAPIFQFLADVVKEVFNALRWFANWITGGLFDQMNDWADTIKTLDEEQQKEADRLKALNDQYGKLFTAIKEQEEYYLQQRRHLNAESAIEQYQTKQVNDMILSPHGAFSTHPEDYIIATKHPETLMGGGGGNVYVNVTNNAGVEVSTQKSVAADGTKVVDIVINAVKREFVNGGFDGAMDAMSARRNGRRQHTW